MWQCIRRLHQVCPHNRSTIYELSIREGDLEGVYLVTLANPDFPVHIKTPLGYQIKDGHCVQAAGNLYGFPLAEQNFSEEFHRFLGECGYENTPWCSTVPYIRYYAPYVAVHFRTSPATTSLLRSVAVLQGCPHIA